MTSTDKPKIKKPKKRPIPKTNRRRGVRTVFNSTRVVCEQCKREYSIGNKARHFRSNIHKRAGEHLTKNYKYVRVKDREENIEK